MNRFRSKGVWAAIIAQTMIIMGTLGLWDKIGITSTAFQGVVDSILTILVLVGVFNNPTDLEKF